MVAKVRSVLKTARTETHKVIMALTCPSTAALYPPCRHHYHHQYHHHHWGEPPSFISCVMEATLRWVFKKKYTTTLLVLTFLSLTDISASFSWLCPHSAWGFHAVRVATVVLSISSWWSHKKRNLLHRGIGLGLVFKTEPAACCRRNDTRFYRIYMMMHYSYGIVSR